MHRWLNHDPLPSHEGKKKMLEQQFHAKLKALNEKYADQLKPHEMQAAQLRHHASQSNSAHKSHGDRGLMS